MPTQIGVLAKHWTPGRVKTRLAETIGEESAASVAKLFLQTLLERLEEVADRSVVGFTPRAAQLEFTRLAGPAWELEPQCEGDLGERIRHYFATAFARGADRVVLLGADSPNLPVERVEEALAALETHRLVLGPAEDGGYYLIGARGEPPPILDAMPWGAMGLWRATLEQLESLGWRLGREWRPLPTWFDVDTMEGLRRLRRELASQREDPALDRLASRIDALLPD